MRDDGNVYGWPGAYEDNEIKIYNPPFRPVSRVLSFPECEIEPRTETKIAVQPDTIIRPHFLVVDPKCAEFYDIVQIQIQNIIYLNNPIPGTCFPPVPNMDKPEHREIIDRFLNKIKFDTIHPAQKAVLTVKHNCNAKCMGVPFNAFFIGIGVE